jgi:DNA-binding XRE family transcriptional regulator
MDEMVGRFLDPEAMINTVRKTAPNPVDQHVGSRVRMRRMMLAMSQTTLGNALGLTFQQVQKYEKGTNRIGSPTPENARACRATRPARRRRHRRAPDRRSQIRQLRCGRGG